MKQKLSLFGLILVGALVLAGAAVADDPKAAASQPKEPVAGAAPAQDPKAAPGQTKEPIASPTPAKEGKAAEGQTTAPAAAAKGYNGKVVDAQTKAPIAGALVTLGDQQVRADKDGAFHLEGAGETLKLRAPGYARRELATSELGTPTADIALTPFMVKALYLSSYGLASKQIREAAKEAIKLNNMNALVIDVKGDRGFIPFKVDIPLAEEVGAQKTILFKDIKAVVASLKEQGLYLIARIVVFKDDPWPRPDRSGPSRVRAAGSSGIGKDCAGSIPSTRRPGITTSPSPRLLRKRVSMRCSSIMSAFPTTARWGSPSRRIRTAAPRRSPVS